MLLRWNVNLYMRALRLLYAALYICGRVSAEPEPGFQRREAPCSLEIHSEQLVIIFGLWMCE